MKKFFCSKCGEEISYDDQVFTDEMDSKGRSRTYRKIPVNCRKCREKSFWNRVDKRVRR